MAYIAIKVPVIESERGWGSKVDDHMVCLSNADANEFIKEFNAENNQPTVPDWYMYAENSTTPIDLSESQYKYLLENKRVWLKELKKK